jgi:hypothetical protein
VLALKNYFGIERAFPDLSRSDHAPFWQAGIPSIMWTDTSEFSNPHYHRPTDTPETLDYDFMADVARLVLARCPRRPVGRQTLHAVLGDHLHCNAEHLADQAVNFICIQKLPANHSFVGKRWGRPMPHWVWPR